MKYRKWQQRVRVQTSYERNIIQAMNELSRISSQLGIPKACVDEAMGIYEQVLTKGLVRGRSVEAIVAACLHMACRKIGMPGVLMRLVNTLGRVGRRSLGASGLLLGSWVLGCRLVTLSFMFLGLWSN